MCFLAPGFLYSLFSLTYTFSLDYVFLVAFVPFCLILPIVRPRFVVYIILVCFMIMELVQFSHIFYFGVPLNSFAISLILPEIGEILDSSSSVFPQALFHIFAVIIPYALLIFLLARFKSFGKIKGFIALGLMIAMLGILPYKALFKTPRIANFMPKDNAVSLLNSLYAFSGYAFILLSKDELALKTYKPYKLEQFDKNLPNQNIVLILGESLSARHLSLLGYERKTTPLLEKMALENSNFYATTAISSSVLTRISMNMFFNITYEYDNVFHITNSPTHLVRLAKLAGFSTFYLSNQTNAESSALLPSHLDISITKEDNLAKSTKLGDLILLDLLDSHIDRFKNGKNFIIIHLRSVHSPYESNYRAYKQADIYPTSNVPSHQYKTNSYDNAVIFNDFIISSIFEKFKGISSKNQPSFVFFTPDHGEATGISESNQQNDIWGHAILDKSVVFIPFLAAAYGDLMPLKQELENFYYPTHYEIGLLLAKMLGFNVKNPNQKRGIFYINGLDISGAAGHFEVHKDSAKKSLEIIKKD